MSKYTSSPIDGGSDTPDAPRVTLIEK
jgi:hypothetical protein